MKENYGILQTCALFHGVQQAELEAMLACLNARKVTAEKEQPIFREGDPADFVGVVLKGAVRILRTDFYGKQTIVGQVEPGDLFGEAFSCAGVRALPVSAVAAQPAEVLLLDIHRVLTLCANTCAFHSRIVSNLVQVLAGKNLGLNQKLDIASRRTTREKLLAYLTAQAKTAGSARFTIPFDRQSLADYLGVERSAMSAELSKLQKEGVLKTRRSQFELL
ncbi:MAG: Crp/Fnr family transcriptional regulator [Clostridia bacterium]|nr:Crp/Fnr family transcriptional regulator [Clostridia bacterium]